MSLKQTEHHFKQICFDKNFTKKLHRDDIYRNLVRSNFIEVIKTAFPTVFKILNESEQKILMDDFFENQKVPHSFYRKIPDYFLEFIKKSDLNEFDNHPYLKELVDYEFLSYDLIFRENFDEKENNNQPDLKLNEICAELNPHLELRYYQYPVFQLEKNPQIKIENKPTYLLMCRHPESFKVFDKILTIQSYQVLQLLKNNPQKTLQQNLEMFLENYDKGEDISSLLVFIKDLVNERIILSFKRRP